ncbi:MAG: GNAT family N-acetyltransferase [Bacillota bacterium]|nr:MAG: GNAT family N-acetyltransferase [Bacillota bacterium]
MPFTMRYAERKDIHLIYDFICLLAQYEKLEHLVTATHSSLEHSLFDLHQAEVIIGEENSAPVSFMLFFHNYSTFLGKANIYLEDLYVKESYRHKGYGKKMFVELANIALERNCERLDWSCLDWNQKAISFYEQIGAKKLNEWIPYRLDKKGIKKLSEEK